MLTTRLIGNTILKKAFQEDIPLSNMKLQKLVYLSYCHYLQTSQSTYLISERFVVGAYGPYSLDLQYAFSSFLHHPIDRFYRTSKGEVKIVKSVDLLSSIDYVWTKYKHFTPINLSKYTMREGSAWDKACANNLQFINEQDMLKEEV